MKDINNLTTNVAYSYDSSGNTTTQVKDSDESGSYTDQGTQKSTCTDSSTLPCMEEDGNTLLYSGAQEQYLYCNTSQPHQVTALSPVSGNPTCSASGTPDYSGTYDAWGNLITRSYSSNNGSLSYDTQDEMVRWNGTTASSSQEEWYLYDAAGNRVLRRSATTALSGNPATSASTITVYAFGLEEHVYSYSGSGSTLSNTNNTYYYSLGGRLIGTLSGISNQSTSFMLTDTLGSVVTTISNTAGSAQLLGNQVYGPYGNKRYSAGSMGTAKGYTGQYNDDVTGLDYYNARYYDPVIGRFLSADDVQGNLSGMDPYDYVGGNLETDTDPTGQFMVIDGGVGNYYSNQYQKAQTAGVGSIWSTILGGSSGSGSHSAPKSASSPSHNPAASVTHFPWGAVGQSHSGGQQHKSGGNPYAPLLKKKTGLDNNQNNALCPGGNTASDCFKWTLAAGHITHTQISMPTLGGMSVNIDVPTVSVSPFNICVNPVACLGEGGDQSQGESESSDSYYFESSACSFTSQTTVATDQGKRPISKLHLGEQVWAYNPKTHKMELQPILHVWAHQDDDLVDLTITPVKPTSQDD